MKLNLFNKKDLEVKIPTKSIINNFTVESSYRVRKTLKDYHDALNSAENEEMPNRYRLLQIYDQLRLDAHVLAATELRDNKAISAQYSVLEGNNISKYNDLFHNGWFYNFMRYCVESIYYGHSLIEVDYIDKQIIVNLVSRKNIIPEFRQYKKNGTDYSGETYLTYNNLIDVYSKDVRNLGLFSSVAYQWILKKEIDIAKAQYIERFGQPIVTATVDTTNPDQERKAVQFLQQLGRSGYAVVDKQTTFNIEDFSRGSKGGTEIYEAATKLCDQQISKLILGGTMILDEGSSYAQAMEHNGQFDILNRHDKSLITNIVNNKLIPLLIRLGVISNCTFSFDTTMDINIKDEMNFVLGLVNSGKYIVDEDTLMKKYGINVKLVSNGEV